MMANTNLYGSKNAMIRLFRGLFASMSLERKCLLFFGSALMVLMFGAFLVVERVGRMLVKNTTKTRARDFADAEVLRLHDDAIWSGGQAQLDIQSKRETLAGLRDELLGESEDSGIEYEILALKDEIRYNDLPSISPPKNLVEVGRLENLKSKYYARLASRIAADRPNVSRPLNLAENEPMSQIGPSFSVASPIEDEEGPIDGRYSYYKPIFFTLQCVQCHSPPGKTLTVDSSDEDPEVLAAQYPFRVMKVTMPYKQTDDQTTHIRAIIVALGMLIVAVTLYVLHAIVRHLVLYPMYHLRDVSDAITHGNTNQRATIETEDEFRELADASIEFARRTSKLWPTDGWISVQCTTGWCETATVAGARGGRSKSHRRLQTADRHRAGSGTAARS